MSFCCAWLVPFKVKCWTVVVVISLHYEKNNGGKRDLGTLWSEFLSPTASHCS